MINTLLTLAGFEEKEQIVYRALLERGCVTVGTLLKHLSIKRGDIYNILYALRERSFIESVLKRGILHFTVTNPQIILDRIRERRAAFEEAEQEALQALPKLKAEYLLSTERPLIQFYEGEEGLREIYEDTLRTHSKDAYFVRANNALVYSKLFGEWFGTYIKKRAQKGIMIHALTPDHYDANHDSTIDEKRNLKRTWLRPQDYTTQMEINLYDDKTCFISYGKEIFAIVVEHAPLAKAMKELFALARKGAEHTVVAHDHCTPTTWA